MLYFTWALAFISRSSYVASDGRLYFLLFDDAMISMRYAWNFSHGYGLVWNAGIYVEGYTNLLMTLLMGLASFFLEKRYAVLAIQLAGIVFVLGTAFFTSKIFKSFKDSNSLAPLKYVLFVLILLYYPLTYWSLLGMETGLLAFLLSAGVYCSLMYVEKVEAKFIRFMAICFGLAYLARNDSILFAGAAFFYVMQVLRSKEHIRTFFISGLIFGLFPASQTIFRFFYYGALVPNTYTLKLIGMALDERLRNGWQFALPFLEETSFVLVISVFGLFLKPTRKKYYLFSFFLISILYQVYIGGDPWTYWRIMTPTIPFVLLLFIHMCFDLFNLLSRFPRYFSYTLVMVLVLVGVQTVDSRFVRQMTLIDVPFHNEIARKHVEISIAVNSLLNKDATVGVFWAGTLPYYTDRFAIDFLGKSDPYIANLQPDMSGRVSWNGMTSVPGHNKYDLSYSIQTLLPTYVEAFYWGNEDVNAWARDNYVRVKYNDVSLFLLKDSPDVNWSKIKVYFKW